VRKRSIDPNFWTDEDVVELDPMARLFFIGLWCVAEDSGVFPLSAKTLKMAVFPGDDITTKEVQSWLDDLVSRGLAVVFSDSGKPWGWIRGFHRYQTLKNSALPKWPLPKWLMCTPVQLPTRVAVNYEISESDLSAFLAEAQITPLRVVAEA
jgi:hypothetical protein